MGKTERIEYIDLSKGFCILLVILSHIMLFYRIDIYPMRFELSTFRMPLYFFLSGLFFKPYTWKLFLIKKTNNLLIPFLFFFITTSVLLPSILSRFLGFQMEWYQSLPITDQIFTPFTTEMFPNIGIWFLLCLFEINMFFYLIYRLCFKNTPCIIFCSLVIGVLGLYLSWVFYDISAYIDTAFSALPFFMAGYLLRNYSDILQKGLSVIIIPFAVLFIYFFAFFTDYRTNFLPVDSAYLCGFSGIYIILYISHKIGKLPLISYLGRYSIIVLCTHALIYQFVHFLLRHAGVTSHILVYNLTITIISYFLIIPLCRKYLPYVTAQKPLLKTGESQG